MELTTESQRGLADLTYVITQIRVGGSSARSAWTKNPSGVQDRRARNGRPWVCRMALRTIPVMQDRENVERLALFDPH